MWQDNQAPTRYVCFYRRTFDDNEHYANLLFDTEAEAYAFGRSIPKVQQILVVTEEEFQSYLNQRYQFLEAELQFHRSRTPRPVQTNITEIIEPEDDYQQGGLVQNVTAIFDEREHIAEPRFRKFHPSFTRPNFASLAFKRKP